MTKRLDLVKTPGKDLSVRQKCDILSVNRSTFYYSPKPAIDRHMATHMNDIADIYARHPFKGYKRICDDLKDMGHDINHKRVYRLMRLMGISAVYPKKNLSKRRLKDVVFPYLLHDFPPKNPHDCWSVDITYIKMPQGFLYLTALIDVVSRCIMGYSLSNCLDTESCISALEMAIKTGYTPKIINSDQGCQFTSQEWLYQLSLLGVRVSMDGKGRCLDNIPIERFWRTLKYEEVYLKTYDTVGQARESIDAYITWYNQERRHSGIGKNRPNEVATGLKKAEKWPFQKKSGYVDNCKQLPDRSISTTTAAAGILNIKQKEYNTADLSSKIAA
jgi:putative transposase